MIDEQRTTGAEVERLPRADQGGPVEMAGSHLGDRRWGTVREDYSDGGDAPPETRFTHAIS